MAVGRHHAPRRRIDGEGCLRRCGVEQAGGEREGIRLGKRTVQHDLRNGFGQIRIDGRSQPALADRAASASACRRRDSNLRQRIAEDPVGRGVGAVRPIARDGDGHGRLRPAGAVPMAKDSEKRWPCVAGSRLPARCVCVRSWSRFSASACAPGNEVTGVGRAAGEIDRSVKDLGGAGELDHFADALARQVGLDQQRHAVGENLRLEVETVIENPHLRRAALEALLAVVEPIGLDAVVPSGRYDIAGGVARARCRFRREPQRRPAWWR